MSRWPPQIVIRYAATLLSYPGIIISQSARLSEVLRPLINELRDHAWFVDTQSGPFNDDPSPSAPSLDHIFDNSFIAADACHHTSSSCWRAGTFPALANRLVLDEWTYLFALPCGEADVPTRAAWIGPRLGRFESDFFDGLPAYADVFFMYADGWWEVYTPVAAFRHLVLAAFPGSYERPASRAGEPPQSAA